jgi:hypothetical protein
MKARPYTPDDYTVISEWWPAHGWPKIDSWMLPASGVVIEDDKGTPLAASWLYMSNSNGVSMMEWTVTNPKNGALTSFRALGHLLEAIKAMAVANDYGVMLTTSKNPALIRLYEKHGFTKTDEGVTHLLAITIK